MTKASREADTAGSLTREGILEDYRTAFRSRQASLLGRKEVFSGKAKFGIFGDGKEVAQVAMARAFSKGDFRSGYYRDQTFMFALGMSTVQEFFAQLYAHADVKADPSSAGRSMTAHFATRNIDDEGRWKDLTAQYNSAADISPTGSQMPRLVGLAYASRLYRELPELAHLSDFSKHGNEIAFGTIGNASCAEGMFWESVNAIGVLQAPALISVWDDGYGISVPNRFQITKSNISEVLAGFQRAPGARDGYDIHRVRGWDYPALMETYREATETVRSEHVPALIHVLEVTQPQGHSTSGSHERYKSKERLQWESEFDCLRKMRDWMITQQIATEEELSAAEAEDTLQVQEWKANAWEAFQEPIRAEREELLARMEQVAAALPDGTSVRARGQMLQRLPQLLRRDLQRACHDVLILTHDCDHASRAELLGWQHAQYAEQRENFSSQLHLESDRSAEKIESVPAVFSENSETLRGFEVLNACFDAALGRMPELIAFGEDVGKLGDVNQGFAGMQAKYGVLRVADVGIRETTILGQAIGMAMRGLRPLVEIQYLDYVLYALQIMSDDLASLTYRTKGGQKAPVIIRTRGHRLEGIWHAGSPMAGILNLVRGIRVCVPRDMTQAAGMYNTLLAAEDPAIVIEVLNGYRHRERKPDNIDTFRVPLGQPEVLRAGQDVTLVTYGACCRIALEAAEALKPIGIEIEVIDIQTLLPFDVSGVIGRSLEKTSRLLLLDEDVPGGATAYMMQKILEEQHGYRMLDSDPVTLSAQAHRPAYGSDGDYWSKPSREDVFRAVYGLMHEADPGNFPARY